MLEIDVTYVQLITLALSLITLGITVWFIFSYRRQDPALAYKALILLTVVVHIFIFYASLVIVRSGGAWLRDLLVMIFHSQTDYFEIWSQSLRLHTVIAILTKETVSIIGRKE